MCFYTFIFEEKENKEMKKNDIKRKDNFWFVVFLGRQTVSIFLHITLITFAL